MQSTGGRERAGMNKRRRPGLAQREDASRRAVIRDAGDARARLKIRISGEIGGLQDDMLDVLAIAANELPPVVIESKAELRIQETRVPKTWSPERRAEALAGRLRRKIRPERIAGLLNVLGSTHRIRVLMTLAGGGATYQHLVKATKLKAGPLYHHVNQLRLAGLVRPRERDLYEITPKGTRALLMAAGMAGMR